MVFEANQLVEWIDRNLMYIITDFWTFIVLVTTSMVAERKLFIVLLRGRVCGIGNDGKLWSRRLAGG